MRPPATGGRIGSGLLVLWLALIGADRIDLFGGAGPFVLTPFLVLTPLVVGAELLTGRKGIVHAALPQATRRYALVASALLLVVLISVFPSRDLPTSGLRAAHLAVIVLATFLAATDLVARRNGSAILLSGMKWGLLLSALFSAGQVVTWAAGSSDPIRLGFATVDLVPMTYAGFVPRPSGAVADANRAGLLYVFAGFVLARWGAGKGKWGWLLLAGLLLILTLSRSAILGAGMTAAIYHLGHSELRISRSAGVAGGMVVLAVLAGLLFSMEVREGTAASLRPFAERFSLQEGSTRTHIHLLRRGVEEATRSPRHLAVGLGYGTSFRVLQDFFPGNRYGNFHSLYLTMWVEAGVVALLITLVLLGYPVVLTGPFRPVVAGAALMNVFYQFAADPLFWLLLALAWMLSRRAARAGAPLRRTIHPVLTEERL